MNNINLIAYGNEVALVVFAIIAIFALVITMTIIITRTIMRIKGVELPPVFPNSEEETKTKTGKER